MDNKDKPPSDANDSGPDLREKALRDALEEGSGFSTYLARAAVSGVAGELIPEPGLPPAADPASMAPVYRRRARRSGNPGTDRDFEPTPLYVPSTAEEIAVRQEGAEQGRRKVERAMGPHNYEKDLATAKRLGIPVQAATRLRVEQQTKRSSQRG